MNEEQFNDLSIEDLQKPEFIEEILKDYKELDSFRAKPTSVINLTPETLAIKETDILVFKLKDEDEAKDHMAGVQAIGMALGFKRINVIFMGEDEDLFSLTEERLKDLGYIRDPKIEVGSFKPVCGSCGKESKDLAVTQFGFDEKTGEKKFSNLCPECREDKKDE